MAKINDIDITSLRFQEGAAPSTPAATKWKQYFKTDGLYVIDDAGTETGPLIASAGAGLSFTAVTTEVVLNTSTAVSVARTLTPAIAAVPADAVLATGYIQINVNTTPNNSNWFAVFHENTDAHEAAIARSGIASGVTLDVPFTCKVTHSTGAKLYYQVSRAAGTITYVLKVLGYWSPA